MPNPLHEFCSALVVEGAPPTGWLDRYAPNGDLRTAWDQCDDPAILAQLALYSPQPVAFAAAEGACLRTLIPLLPPDDQDLARRCIAFGEEHPLAVDDGVIEAVEQMYAEVDRRLGDVGGRTEDMRSAMLHACAGLLPDPSGAANLVDAITRAAEILEDHDPSALPALAAIVRRHVRCPTLAEAMRLAKRTEEVRGLMARARS